MCKTFKNIIINNLWEIITFVCLNYYWMFKYLRSNISFVIVSIFLSILSIISYYLYKKNKCLNIELSSISDFNDEFEIKLQDNTIVKSGSKIQLKNDSDMLIAISYNEKTKYIKYMDKDNEKTSHISTFKMYKYISPAFFI